MRFLLLFSMLSCLLCSCGLFKRKEEPKPTGPKTTLVGIVEMVNPEQNYVLIRCEQVPALGPGTELIALDATGVESKLKLTPERKGRYLTADITGGQPKVMNLVIYRTSGAETPTVPTAPVPAPVPMPEVPPIPLEPGVPPQVLLEPLLPTTPPMEPVKPTVPTPTLDLEPPVQ